MKTEQWIREQIDHHKASLAGWNERGGWLLPTEPDPEEREKVRERLKVAISTLEWVLE